MSRLYIILAFRNLIRGKLYSVINILGLAVGFLAFLAIMLYVNDEFSYDNFHAKKDRIYRLWNLSSERELAITPYAWAALMKAEIAEIEDAVTLQPMSVVVERSQNFFNESKVFAVDSSLFKIFDFPILQGQRTRLLYGTNDVVISPEASVKYFGDEDPIGQLINIDLYGNSEPFVVRAVADSPDNSHLQFDVLIPYELVRHHSFNPPAYESMRIHFVYTYLLLNPNADASTLPGLFKDFFFRHGGETLRDRYNPDVEPMLDVYLKSEKVFDNTAQGSIAQVRILTIVSIAILMIAIVNFINLSTAQSLRRAKEVGLRKVFGSNQRSLVTQFLIESTLTSIIALGLAFVALLLLLPGLNGFTEKNFGLMDLLSPFFLFLMFSATIITGIFAGLYPAFVISKFQPLKILRSKSAYKTSGQLARKLLVIFQFSAAVILLVSTWVVYKQVRHMDDAALGFTSEQVIVVHDNGVISADPIKLTRLKDQLLKVDGVEALTGSSSYPGIQAWSVRYVPEGFANDENMSLLTIFTDFDFLKTYEINLVEGRDVNKELASDSLAFIINEAARDLFAVKDESWLTDPLNKKILYPYGNNDEGHVVGVVENFHLESLQKEVEPLVIQIDRDGTMFDIQIRLSTDDFTRTLAEAESVWKDLFPATPFDYQFVDDVVGRYYQADRRLGKLFSIFSLFAIFVTILGLFSLASFLAHERSKEMSIRRVIGATRTEIYLLLTRKFNVLVLIGNMIGIPVAYFLMNQWLGGFAYRIDVTPVILLGSFLVSFLISSMATVYHAYQSANRNPARVLAQE